METQLIGALFMLIGLCFLTIGTLLMLNDSARNWFAQWKYVGRENDATRMTRALTRYFNGPIMIISGLILVRIALSILGIYSMT